MNDSLAASGTAAPDPLQESVAGGLPDDFHTSVHLMREAQKGDTEALNDLLARYQSRVERIVRVRLSARLKQYVESVDIVQDTFAIAFRKIDDFELRSHASILNWLARIAENTIRDKNAYHAALKRDRGRERDVDAPIDDSNPSGMRLAADQSAVSSHVARREVREIMDQAMAQLPDDYREVILFRDYSGADWDFVAEAMERSKHACQELHRRAWIRLRSLVHRTLE